jgi:hypothetical protein
MTIIYVNINPSYPLNGYLFDAMRQYRMCTMVDKKNSIGFHVLTGNGLCQLAEAGLFQPSESRCRQKSKKDDENLMGGQCRPQVLTPGKALLMIAKISLTSGFILPKFDALKNRCSPIQGIIVLIDDVPPGTGYVRRKPSRPFGVAFFMCEGNVS